MKRHVGIRSLAVNFPDTVRTNDYWREKYPEAIAAAEQKSLARLFSAKSAAPPTDPFDIEMLPFLEDPFRGAVERRVLRPGEGALGLELGAAQAAVAAAGMSPQDLQAVMVGSLPPDTHALGNAAHLTRRMGLSVAAWNVE